MAKIVLLAVLAEGMWEGLEEIGICSIAACLRENEHEVMLISSMEEEIDYEKIRLFAPDVIGYPVYEKSRKAVYRVIEAIIDRGIKCKHCVGGVLPTYYKKQMLIEFGNTDFSIIGEGENAFVQLMQALDGKRALKDVEGLVYRDEHGIIFMNEQAVLQYNLDELPPPARDILCDKKLKVAQISSSRGCMARCSFCSSQLFLNKWKGRSPAHIVAEIKALQYEHDIHIFNFIDCSFEDPGFNYQRMYDIAQGIIDENLVISFMVNLRAGFYKKSDEKLFSLLKKAGMCTAFIGIESANSSDLRHYYKWATVEDNYKVMDYFAQHDTDIQPGFINFQPFSTLDSLKDNFTFLKHYKLMGNYGLYSNQYRLYYGTSMYNAIVKNNLTKPDEQHELSYRFMDERVGGLCSYINKDFAEFTTVYNALHLIENYASIYKIIVEHYKNIFFRLQYDELLLDVAHYQEKSKEILDSINLHISNWYGALLELAEMGWQKELADELTKTKLDGAFLQAAVADLNTLRNALQKSIIKKRPTAYKYVLSSF